MPEATRQVPRIRALVDCQAYERGFKVIVAADACANDDPALQEHELRVLRKGFARVLDTAAILTLLESTA